MKILNDIVAELARQTVEEHYNEDVYVIALRGLLRAALEVANGVYPHDDGGEGGTFRHISAALRNVGDGEALEYWADTGEWPH